MYKLSIFLECMTKSEMEQEATYLTRISYKSFWKSFSDVAIEPPVLLHSNILYLNILHILISYILVLSFYHLSYRLSLLRDSTVYRRRTLHNAKLIYCLILLRESLELLVYDFTVRSTQEWSEPMQYVLIWKWKYVQFSDPTDYRLLQLAASKWVRGQLCRYI